MCDPFFGQEPAKTQIQNEDSKSNESKTRGFAFYPDTDSELKEITEALSRATGSGKNKSVAIRAIVAYAHANLKKDEKKLSQLFINSRSRR